MPTDLATLTTPDICFLKGVWGATLYIDAALGVILILSNIADSLGSYRLESSRDLRIIKSSTLGGASVIDVDSCNSYTPNYHVHFGWRSTPYTHDLSNPPKDSRKNSIGQSCLFHGLDMAPRATEGYPVPIQRLVTDRSFGYNVDYCIQGSEYENVKLFLRKFAEMPGNLKGGRSSSMRKLIDAWSLSGIPRLPIRNAMYVNMPQLFLPMRFSLPRNQSTRYGHIEL